MNFFFVGGFFFCVGMVHTKIQDCQSTCGQQSSFCQVGHGHAPRTRYKSQAKPSTDDCKERVIELEKVESLEEIVRTLVQELDTLKETISHAMHKQQGDTGKKFVDDDDVIYIPA